MVNTAKVYASFELRHSLDAAGRIRLYGFWMTVEAWYIPLHPIWCWKIDTSCFISTHDDSLLWIYIYCCVIFKRNYWPLLQLSDSHVVSSISNSYRDAVTGVHVQLPHMIITSAPVHTLHIAVSSYTICMPHMIKVSRFQTYSVSIHFLNIIRTSSTRCLREKC